MKRKKRKLKKGVKVIIFVLIIMILLGGIFIYMSVNNKDNQKGDKQVMVNDDSNNNVDKVQDEVSVNQELRKTPKNNIEFSSLTDGEYVTDKGYKVVIKDGLSYVDNYLIVNKTYKLPSDYKPVNPANPVRGDWCTDCIDKDVLDAFNKMKADASSLGLNIYIASGYRGYNNQNTLYNNYVARDGVAAADKYSARPGYSEHQTGLCFDLNSVNDSFASTNEGIWVNSNAYLYGFIIRYPKGHEDETGYQYESWHLRYVGTGLAKKLYNNGEWITMEDYFGLTSSYE